MKLFVLCLTLGIVEFAAAMNLMLRGHLVIGALVWLLMIPTAELHDRIWFPRKWQPK